MNNEFYQPSNNYKPCFQQNKFYNPGGMNNSYPNSQGCFPQKPQHCPKPDHKPEDDCKPKKPCESKKLTIDATTDECGTTLNLVIPSGEAKATTITIENSCDKKECQKKCDDKKDCDKKECNKKDCDKKECDKKDYDKKESFEEKRQYSEYETDMAMEMASQESTITTLEETVSLEDVVKTVNALITSLTNAGILTN